MRLTIVASRARTSSRRPEAGGPDFEQATADATAFLDAVLQGMTDRQVRDLTSLLDRFVFSAEAVLQAREAVV